MRSVVAVFRVFALLLMLAAVVATVRLGDAFSASAFGAAFGVQLLEALVTFGEWLGTRLGNQEREA